MSHRLLPALAALCCLGLLISLAPAQDGKRGRAVVMGKVTVAGQPLKKGQVEFHPPRGRSITAPVNVDGTYRATNVPLGKHKVTVRGGGVPGQFTDARSTPLIVEVAKQENLLDFDLSK